MEDVFVQKGEGEVVAHTFEGGFPDDLRRLHTGDPSRPGRLQLDTAYGSIHDFSEPLFRGVGGRAGAKSRGGMSIAITVADLRIEPAARCEDKVVRGRHPDARHRWQAEDTHVLLHGGND